MDRFGDLPIHQTDYHANLKELSKSPIEQWLESFVRENATFTQTGGEITIDSVTATDANRGAFGIDVGVEGKFNVKNLTISADEESDNSIGFVSKSPGVVDNSGVVSVSGTDIKYSTDGINGTNPLPPQFIGTGTYS